MSIAAVTAAVGLIKSATEGLKAAAGLAKKLNNREVTEKLSDVISTMTDVQLQVMELAGKLNELNSENESLKGELARRGEYIFVDKENCFQQKQPDGLLTGHYCPRCYDAGEGPVNMLTNNERTRHICPKCKTATKQPELVGGAIFTSVRR